MPKVSTTLLRWLVCLPLLTLSPAHAADAPPAARDPALEARVIAFTTNLRCLVCQNESLAASQADLAIDLKNQIRDKMRAGESDDAIRAYLVDRYGDFVLYNPPLKATTVLLWAGPFALLVIGLVVLALNIRRRAAAGSGALSDEDHARARELLQEAERQ